jgi:type VI secretion system protein ImpK
MTLSANLINSPLLQNFQVFYYEVLRLKEKALRATESRILMEDEVSSDQPYDMQNKNLVDDFQKRLRNLLDEQSGHHARLVGGVSSTIFKDMHYIMVILADEIFINLNWAGAKEWRASLLEAQLFQTQIAGELFFKKLDALFDSNDPVRFELAQIYLMVLSLGFKGQYKDREDQDRIRWYQDQLYTMVCHHPLKLFNHDESRMIEQCYEHTINTPPGKGLPDLRVWTTWILSVFVAYIFITYVIWYKMAADLEQDLQMIFDQTRQMGNAT